MSSSSSTFVFDFPKLMWNITNLNLIILRYCFISRWTHFTGGFGVIHLSIQVGEWRGFLSDEDREYIDKFNLNNLMYSGTDMYICTHVLRYIYVLHYIILRYKDVTMYYNVLRYKNLCKNMCCLTLYSCTGKYCKHCTQANFFYKIQKKNLFILHFLFLKSTMIRN